VARRFAMNASDIRPEATEDYVTRKYCVSRQQAKRVLRQYGRDKAEIDILLGAKGRTPGHRRQDVRRTASEVTFG
jgi:hypothetical protein